MKFPLQATVQALALSLVLGSAMGQAQAPAEDPLALNATERAWLEASLPVLLYGRAQGLPLDVVVQPQDAPGLPAMGMALDGGRCKLVLSMRGNPQADATVASVPAPLFEAVVQAVAAHELGHCWRHVHQRWGQLPAGLHSQVDFGAVPAAQAALIREMWRTRREEGFADLVGLAWTQRHHPARYAEVHAWLSAVRAHPPIEGAHHDTRVWVRLARDPGGFAPAESLFEQVERLWADGLVAGL